MRGCLANQGELETEWNNFIGELLPRPLMGQGDGGGDREKKCPSSGTCLARCFIVMMVTVIIVM